MPDARGWISHLRNSQHRHGGRHHHARYIRATQWISQQPSGCSDQQNNYPCTTCGKQCLPHSQRRGIDGQRHLPHGSVHSPQQRKTTSYCQRTNRSHTETAQSQAGPQRLLLDARLHGARWTYQCNLHRQKTRTSGCSNSYQHTGRNGKGQTNHLTTWAGGNSDSA